MIKIELPLKPLVILTAPDDFDPWVEGPDKIIVDIATAIDIQLKKLPLGWKASIEYL